MPDITEQNRQQWLRKPALRAVYEDLYLRIDALLVPGVTLETGGGSGNLKAYRPEVISSDIAPYPWLDLVADAQQLPVASGALSNIVLFDVLHHLEYPILFLREAERALRRGGRVLMVEPAITAVSGPFYRWFHCEPVMLDCDPFACGVPDAQRDPFTANQALPTLLFSRQATRLRELLPGLEMVSVDWLSLIAYPMTGGFNRWSLIPPSLVKPVIALENRLPPGLRRRLAFRMLVCLQKVGTAAGTPA